MTWYCVWRVRACLICPLFRFSSPQILGVLRFRATPIKAKGVVRVLSSAFLFSSVLLKVGYDQAAADDDDDDDDDDEEEEGDGSNKEDSSEESYEPFQFKYTVCKRLPPSHSPFSLSFSIVIVLVCVCVV